MGRDISAWVLGFTLLVAGALLPLSAEPSTSSAVPCLVPAPAEPLTAYRGLRRVHVVSARFGQEAWLDAWTELTPQGFTYRILSERGSEQVRNRVLRPMLAREQELMADGTSRAALSDENYVFTEPAALDSGDRYVLMKPRRKDVVLVDGRAVLTPDGGDVLRVEGRLARTPSFWTSRVDVTRRFASVDGVRVTVAIDTIARVKLAGDSRLRATYEYESINGRPVSLTARDTLTARSR